MDEATLIQDILDRMLERTQGARRRIRVVNLSVYDKSVDTKELTRAFKSLAFNTLAQDANLHVRLSEAMAKGSSIGSLPVCPSNLVRLDSLEMEDAVIPSH